MSVIYHGDAADSFSSKWYFQSANQSYVTTLDQLQNLSADANNDDDDDDVDNDTFSLLMSFVLFHDSISLFFIIFIIIIFALMILTTQRKRHYFIGVIKTISCKVIKIELNY